MKIKYKFITAVMLIAPFSFSFASSMGFCNNGVQTQYACCSEVGGWLVGNACPTHYSDGGSRSELAHFCTENSSATRDGEISGTIVQDCKTHGGSSVTTF